MRITIDDVFSISDESHGVELLDVEGKLLGVVQWVADFSLEQEVEEE